MSIELPEAAILAGQMNQHLRGKRINSWHLEDLAKLQKSKMVRADLEAFDRLVGSSIESVVSRGNTIRVKLNGEYNLIISPEYGGEILYHEKKTDRAMKIHLNLEFEDGTVLTIRLKGWGAIYPLTDHELEKMYTYARDFSDTMSPDDPAFTRDSFTEILSKYTKNIKMALVGKDAIIVGIQNSAFQDIIYRAGIHPKRRASDLDSNEANGLFDAIVALITERKAKGGKDQFIDLYGKQGEYVPVMGPNMKDENCPRCGGSIEKLAHGGGHVYICSSCQKADA